MRGKEGEGVCLWVGVEEGVLGLGGLGMDGVGG